VAPQLMDRLTRPARQAVQLAQEEAGQRGSLAVAPAHLTLALTRLPDSIAASFLGAFGIDPADLYDRIVLTVPSGPPTAAALPFTATAGRVLKLAFQEAIQLGAPCVGTEHLLLGLLAVAEPVALRATGVYAEPIRQYLQPAPPAVPPREPVAVARRRGRSNSAEATGRVITHSHGAVPGPIVAERFTGSGVGAVLLAREEAVALGHRYVAPEHLFLGMLRQEGTVAVQALSSLGFTLPFVRFLVESMLGRGTDAPTEQVTLTFRARAALVAAQEIATQLGRAQVGAEHLLLGIVGQAGGVPAQVIAHAGRTPQQVGDQVLAVLRQEYPQGAGPAADGPAGAAEPAPAQAPAAQPKPVVILTALELEYAAVRAHLVGLEPVGHRAGTVFEVGTLHGSARRIAVAVIGEGNQTAAIVTERAATMFAPEAVLFVGVAGALKGDIRLGDVVVATRTYFYPGGKDDNDGFQARPQAWDAPHHLEQWARYIARLGNWQQRRPVGDQPPTPVHFKPIAAGDMVLGSRTSSMITRIRRYYNDSAAVEMEGAGVARAAHLNRMPALIVRGVSDNADEGKAMADRAGWQQAAAANAAAFAIDLIASLPAPA
jgi:nucleoside phosphorylase